MLEAFCRLVETRRPQSGRAREEDVCDMRYRYRNVSLFPEDLNADYDPYDFIEEPVEPRSFRAILTGILAWMVGIPFLIFLIVYQDGASSVSALLADRQVLMAKMVSRELQHRFESLSERLEEVANTLDVADSQAAQRFWQAARTQLPVAGVTLEHAADPGRHLAKAGVPDEALPSVRLDVVLGGERLRLVLFFPRDAFNGVFQEVTARSGAQVYLYDVHVRELFRSLGAVDAPQPCLKTKVRSGVVYDVCPEKLTLAFPAWTVLIDQHRTDMMLEQRRKTLSAGLWLIIAVGAVFVVGFWVSRPLSRSVAQLKEAVERFARTGDVPSGVTLPPGAPTELVAFAERFCELAKDMSASRKRLADMNRHLEETVVRRTRDLAARHAELAAVQRLLTPISMPLQAVVDETVARFRQLLGLSTLYLRSARDGDEQTLSPELATLQVKHGEHVIGWLVAPRAALEEREKRNSLELLGHSIAVMMANRRLLLSTIEQHRLLSALFLSMNEGVVLLDAAGRIVRSNAYFNDLMTVADLRPDAERALRTCLDAAFTLQLKARGGPRRVLAPDEPFVLGNVYEWVSKSRVYAGGRETVLAVTTFPVTSSPADAEAPVLGLMVRDVSEDRQLSRLKEELLSVVAHELKTPITALRLQAETLATASELSQEEREDILKDMLEESFRLRNLVDDWLDLTRFRDGVIELRRKVVHIATPIDKAARLVATRFPLTVEREIAPDAECFCFDPERLSQVFINLFSNAARYARPGQEARVHVRVVRRGDTVTIVVADEGVGIEPERLQHIFERYYQADLSMTRMRGGTGLGLTIVKGIVEAHRGGIRAESEPGKGTTFTISLPY